MQAYLHYFLKYFHPLTNQTTRLYLAGMSIITKELYALRCDCNAPRSRVPRSPFFSDCPYCEDLGYISVETGLDSSLWSFFVNDRSYGPDEVIKAHDALQEAVDHSKVDEHKEAMEAYGCWAFAMSLYSLQ